MTVFRTERGAWLVVGLSFLLLCSLKFLFLFPETYGPTILNDELVYVHFARQIVSRGYYGGVNYPLLYPSLIAICLQFGDNFYSAIKTMNIVLSSLVVVPAYLLSRLALPRLESILVVALVAVLPYHLVMPRLIMSENLYFPLFLFTLYLCLRTNDRHRWAWDILLGVCIGALFLTRYLTVPLLPGFAAIWLITNWERGARPWVRGALVFFAAVITASPWFVMGFSNGYKLSSLLGFKIASRPDPGQRTVARLVAWSWLYLSYYALISAPFLAIIVAGTPPWIRSVKEGGLYRNRVPIAIGIITVLLSVAVVRHSWSAAYNFPHFSRIMGRYLIYLVPLFAILALTLAAGAAHQSKRTVVLVSVASSALIGLAYATLIEGAILSVKPRFLTDRGSLDAYAVKAAGLPWLVVLAVTIGVVCYILYNRQPGAARASIAGAVISVLVAYPTYHNDLSVYVPQTVAAHELHRRGIKKNFVVYTQHLNPIEGRPAGPAVAKLLPFWGLSGVQAEIFEEKWPRKTRHFVIGPSPGLAQYQPVNTLRVFTAKGIEYQMIEVDPAPLNQGGK